MKILYLDFLFPKSHLRLDINQIKVLSKIADVTVLSSKGRYKQFKKIPENVNIIECDSLESKTGRFNNRIASFMNMLVTSKISKKENYDIIIISSFDTINFAIGRLFFNKKARMYLIHHFNTDELKNRVKKFFFKQYMNKVDHIVYQDFIKDYLVEYIKVDDNKIHVIPQHTNIIDELNSINNFKKYNCIGLSNSNNEDIIREIVDLEKEKQFLKNHNLRVILKSKYIEFDNNYLKVIRGYIENHDFEEYVKNSQFIYMPFLKSFEYRMSGTLIDALSNNTRILCSDIKLTNYYANKYPSICKIVHNVYDFFKEIRKSAEENTEISNDFSKFREDHSSKKIEKVFKEIFNL